MYLVLSAFTSSPIYTNTNTHTQRTIRELWTQLKEKILWVFVINNGHTYQQVPDIECLRICVRRLKNLG